MRKDDSKYYLHNIVREYLSFQGANGLQFLRMGMTFSRTFENGTEVKSELDHLLTNCPDEFTEYGTIEFDSSDHKIIMAEVCFERTKPGNKKIIARDLRGVRKNPEILKNAIATQNWHDMVGMEDVNDMVESWSNKIITALDKVAPKKEKVLKNGKKNQI